VGHLSYFRVDKGYVDFRVRRDDEYWATVRQLIRKFGKDLKYKQATGLFSIPNTGRGTARLATIFPEEWQIVTSLDTDEITFNEGEQ